MKKMRKIMSLLLAMVMVASLLSGCSKKSNENKTMFTAMEAAGNFEKYTYSVDVEVESSMSDIDGIEISLSGAYDGKSISLGVDVSYSFISFKSKELLVITEDAMYVNVEDVLKVLNKYASPYIGGEIDLEELIGIDVKWAELPYAKGLINLSKSKDSVALSSKLLEAALDGIDITDEDGMHKATIKNAKKFAKFIENFCEAILDNEDDFRKLMSDSSSIDEDAIRETIELYMNAIVDAMKKVAKDNDIEITDAEIEEFENEMNSAVDEAMEELNLEDYADDMDSAIDDMFDELKDGMDDLKSELADLEDNLDIKFTIENGLDGNKGERTYSCNATVEAEADGDDITVTIKSVMTEDDELEVKKPSDVTPLADLLYAVIGYVAENGGLGDMTEVVEPEIPTEEVTEIPLETESVSDYVNYNYTYLTDGGYWADFFYNAEIFEEDYSNYGDDYMLLDIDGDSQTQIEVDYYGGMDFQTAFDTCVNGMQYEYNEIAAYEITGYPFYCYEIKLYDDTYYYEYYFAGIAFENSTLLAFAPMDTVKSTAYDAVTLFSEIFAGGVSEYYTGSEEGGKGDGGDLSEVEYDGEILFTMYDGTEFTLIYDPKEVHMDPNYTDTNYGSFCAEIADDEYVYAWGYFDTYYKDAEEYYNAEIKYSSDYYTFSEMTEMSTPAGKGYYFTKSYTEGDFNEKNEYFILNLDKGILAVNSTKFDPRYTDATFEEFLKVLLLEVK